MVAVVQFGGKGMFWDRRPKWREVNVPGVQIENHGFPAAIAPYVKTYILRECFLDLRFMSKIGNVTDCAHALEYGLAIIHGSS